MKSAQQVPLRAPGSSAQTKPRVFLVAAPLIIITYVGVVRQIGLMRRWGIHSFARCEIPSATSAGGAKAHIRQGCVASGSNRSGAPRGIRAGACGFRRSSLPLRPAFEDVTEIDVFEHEHTDAQETIPEVV